MVFDLATEDLGGSLVGELNNERHALDEHPLLEQVLVKLSIHILDAWLFKLLTRVLMIKNGMTRRESKYFCSHLFSRYLKPIRYKMNH